MKNEREQAIEELRNWMANLPIGVVYKAEGKALLNRLLETPPRLLANHIKTRDQRMECYEIPMMMRIHT